MSANDFSFDLNHFTIEILCNDKELSKNYWKNS